MSFTRRSRKTCRSADGSARERRCFYSAVVISFLCFVFSAVGRHGGGGQAAGRSPADHRTTGQSGYKNLGADWGQTRSASFLRRPNIHNCKSNLIQSECFQIETAENIGYSCNMLREEMKDIFIVAANTAEGVKEELE